jgi:hypothetical protein
MNELAYRWFPRSYPVVVTGDMPSHFARLFERHGRTDLAADFNRGAFESDPKSRRYPASSITSRSDLDQLL